MLHALPHFTASLVPLAPHHGRHARPLFGNAHLGAPLFDRSPSLLDTLITIQLLLDGAGYHLGLFDCFGCGGFEYVGMEGTPFFGDVVLLVDDAGFGGDLRAEAGGRVHLVDFGGEDGGEVRRGGLDLGRERREWLLFVIAFVGGGHGECFALGVGERYRRLVIGDRHGGRHGRRRYRAIVIVRRSGRRRRRGSFLSGGGGEYGPRVDVGSHRCVFSASCNCGCIGGGSSRDIVRNVVFIDVVAIQHEVFEIGR
mmetsp:Transcript_15330/g.32952  ORF Transcript_15330/g.32952 Transcript_15330/m.32952 type:complete len:254 (+) Transcript_15330:484-1245(+)